jgi:hypothetical protein
MEFVVALTAIGCGTGIVITFIDKVFGGQKKKYQDQARLAEERARALELQLAEARRQAQLLEKQVEWHSRLLETQDRLVKQIGAGQPGQSANGADAATSEVRR